MIAWAARIWGLEDWVFTWKYADIETEAEIDPTYWTEKRAEITLNKSVKDIDRKRLLRLILHKEGHCVVYPIWRSMTDWTDNLASKKMKDVYEDATNSAENIVIDHLIVKTLKM